VSYDQKPFEDVVLTADGFSLPDLKWRELLFIGAVRRQGEVYVRDPARFLPPFAQGELLPVGARFVVAAEGGRVRLTRL
jgi:hypothetical protein